MPYLIDGHNLIGQMPDISLSDPNDEAKLVQRLAGFAARTRKPCIVIFDHGIPGGWSSMSTASVKVIFASAGQSSADHIMMERIRQAADPSNWTVVSSDAVILRAAETRGMKTLRAQEFAAAMRRTPQRPDRGEQAHVYVPPEEVEEWLELFKKKKKP